MTLIPEVGQVVDEPPPDRRRKRTTTNPPQLPDRQRVVDAADGKWVVVYVGRTSPSCAYYIKHSEWFREGNYECVHRRTLVDGIGAVYVRRTRSHGSR